MTVDVAVDPVRCTGHGICALLVPERVGLDMWGFPVVDPTPVDDPRVARKARRAARACPRRALVATLSPSSGSRPTVGR